MKLSPETLAAHAARIRSLEPQQPMLPLALPTYKRFSDNCPRCNAPHINAHEAEACRQANTQREQY